MNYLVMCRVSGGVTGTRESVLKSNGDIVRFDTRSRSQPPRPRNFNKRRNSDPFRVANYQYWVITEFPR